MHPEEFSLFEKANNEKQLQKIKTDAGKLYFKAILPKLVR